MTLGTRPGVAPFNSFYYRSCFHMPLMAAVYSFGGDIAPFLANDVFVYASAEGAGPLDLTALHLAARPEVEVLAEQGIAFRRFRPERSLDAAIGEELDAGALVLVPVDRFAYASTYNTLHRLEHYPHHVLVCRLDGAAAQFEVIDAPETPIEGKNAFVQSMAAGTLAAAYSSYLEFCDPAGDLIALSPAPGGKPHGAEAPAAVFARTARDSRAAVLAGLERLEAQARALRSTDPAVLKREPLATVLRHLFPVDRAKEAELERVRRVVPRSAPALGPLMAEISRDLKEYKLALGSFLLAGRVRPGEPDALAARLDRIHGRERTFQTALAASLADAEGAFG